MCSNKIDCLPVIKYWIKLFYSVFLVLSVCSVGVFAMKDEASNSVYLGEMVIIFWVLFAVLLLVGTGLSLSFLLGEGDEGQQGSNVSSDDSQPPSIYGRSGYRH